MKSSTKTASVRQGEIGELTEYLNANIVREFEFSDADFRHIVQLARMHTGIALSDSKFNLVYGRLSRRLRALGMSAFRQYREYLDGPEGHQEIERFINSISTNLTKLFREAHHFDHLRDRVAAPFATAARGKLGQRLRIWSAGCSTGEEPYTIAMVLKHAVPNIASQDARILATDIDTDVLAKATEGVYPAAHLDDVPAAYRPLLQPKGARAATATVSMPDELRALIAFRRLNLMEPWPMRGLFDGVFCRNVMIYFDGPTKTALIERFAAQIKPGGFLYIGHSESLLGTHPGLEPMGHTVYRRSA